MIPRSTSRSRAWAPGSPRPPDARTTIGSSASARTSRRTRSACRAARSPSTRGSCRSPATTPGWPPSAAMRSRTRSRATGASGSASSSPCKAGFLPFRARSRGVTGPRCSWSPPPSARARPWVCFCRGVACRSRRPTTSGSSSWPRLAITRPRRATCGSAWPRWAARDSRNFCRPTPRLRHESLRSRPGPPKRCSTTGPAGPLRGPRPGRRARRRMPRGVPAAGVGAHGGEAERAVALQQRGPRDQPALRLAREGRRDGRRGTHPHRAGHAQGRGPRQERDARRRRARQVRGVGPRAIRGIRPHRPAEAGLALRQAVGPGSLAVHVPVLVDEVAFVLRPRRGGWVIDGTVGMGGHAEAVLRTSGDDVRLLGIDVDPEALARARARLARYAERVTLARADFRQLARVAGEHGIREARAVLLDLGVSSYQLDESGRGFSFQQNEPLDMLPGLLALGGRLGVISFHSGEDRIVKQTFRALAAANFAELEPSPLTPGDDEVRANPRARSAKLRVLERTS